MTMYCYDTEFIEDGKTIDLISIGIVCEDGREYYAINSDADWDRIRDNDWLMENVVPHLPTHSAGQVEKRRGFGEKGYLWGGLNMRDSRVKPRWVIANEVRDFLLAKPLGTSGEWQPNPELWAYYAAYDHVALCQLWGRMISLPSRIPMWTNDLQQELHRLKMPPPGPSADAHDALADARWGMGVLDTIRERDLLETT